MAKHPTTKKRKTAQRKKQRYMKLREDLQVSGEIYVSSEGAVRDEKVDPSSQEEQRLDALDRAAVNRGWRVPEEKKAAVINRLVEVVLGEDTKPFDVALNAKTLLVADQKQWERDHPEEAGKAKGGVGGRNGDVNVNVAVVDPWSLYQRAIQEASVDQVEQRIEAVDDGRRDEIAASDSGDGQAALAGGGVLRQAEEDNPIGDGG